MDKERMRMIKEAWINEVIKAIEGEGGVTVDNCIDVLSSAWDVENGRVVELSRELPLRLRGLNARVAIEINSENGKWTLKIQSKTEPIIKGRDIKITESDGRLNNRYIYYKIAKEIYHDWGRVD